MVLFVAILANSSISVTMKVSASNCSPFGPARSSPSGGAALRLQADAVHSADHRVHLPDVPGGQRQQHSGQQGCAELAECFHALYLRERSILRTGTRCQSLRSAANSLSSASPRPISRTLAQTKPKQTRAYSHQGPRDSAMPPRASSAGTSIPRLAVLTARTTALRM